MAEQLGKLKTFLGERPLYDAASQCSRCGYCEQACPTYVATGRETFSPRGRNQIVRQLAEGRLENTKEAEEALSTCLLCGACQTICYAKVPVPDIALEGRRMLRARTHWMVRFVSSLMIRRPGVFALLLKSGFVLKRLGISRLGRPFLRLFGLGVLANMDAHSDEAPLKNLDDLLAPRSAVKPSWRYYAACGPRYLLPRVGTATWKAVNALVGPGAYLNNPCCGLLANNYGELSDARELAKRNIRHAEENGGEPIVGDCSSCVAFLKSYPQLFLDDHEWQLRAEKFSARIKDVLEVYGENSAALPAAVRAQTCATYHDSCRAINGQGLKDEPRRAAKAVAGESYCEMAGSDACCGGAGAFGFVHEELSDQLLKTKIGNAAKEQAEVILTSSTSCLVQLARGLRKYYPEAKALHLSEYVAGALGNPHGA